MALQLQIFNKVEVNDAENPRKFGESHVWPTSIFVIKLSGLFNDLRAPETHLFFFVQNNGRKRNFRFAFETGKVTALLGIFTITVLLERSIQ